MASDSPYTDLLMAAAVALFLCGSLSPALQSQRANESWSNIFFSLHQPRTSGNMLDTDKCNCSLSLVEQDIDPSGFLFLLHSPSKTREQLMVSTV